MLLLCTLVKAAGSGSHCIAVARLVSSFALHPRIETALSSAAFLTCEWLAPWVCSVLCMPISLTGCVTDCREFRAVLLIPCCGLPGGDGDRGEEKA